MNLHLSDFSFGYNKALNSKPINITAEKGKLIALIGKNGAGKSTFLKSIAGIIPPISGKIKLGNEEINPDNISKKISIVLTRPPLEQLKVSEILKLGRIPYINRFDHLKAEDFKKIDTVEKKLKIKHLSDKKMDQISDGEKQLVMIARSLIQDTPIIILDEPTTHLDLQNKAMIFSLLGELSKQGKIIIFSTHDLNLILTKVDEMWILDKKILKKIDNFSQADEDLRKTFPSKNIFFDGNCKIFRLN